MKYRNEFKFICNDNDLILIENRISKILQLDSHTKQNNKYFIHSLYFDDIYNSCAFDNDAGVGNRYKWRIRCYDDNSFIRLERKEKNNSLCRKLSCVISFEEYEDIINNNVNNLFWQTNNKLLRQFCLEVLCRRFAPTIIIDYERTAYVEPITNIRITFDKNICGSIHTEKFMSGNYVRYPLLNKNEHVLEVKFDDILPSYIAQAIHIKTLKQTTFSKYYYGRATIERN